MMCIHYFFLSLHLKTERKYAKYSEVWTELTGTIISTS